MLLLAILAACTGDASDDADPTPLPSGETGAACAVTWDNFGRAFTLQACQPCHASTTPNRFGAPESVAFDTEEDAIAWAPRILARSTGDDPDMPPSGGVSEQDRQLLEDWITCNY